MNTIIYLIRHSMKFDPNNINIYNTKHDKQIKTEKKMLSVEGEIKAKNLSQEKEFEDVEAVYCSDYVRTMQTAKYFIFQKNLKLNIDERFNERKKGNIDLNNNPQFISEQYWNKELKAEGGESQIEVNKRMSEAFWDVVKNNKNKKSVIISHGTAMSFLLMNWCELVEVNSNYLRVFKYNGEILINRIFKAPEVFKITINNENQITNIENLEFDKLDVEGEAWLNT